MFGGGRGLPRQLEAAYFGHEEVASRSLNLATTKEVA
jgi:hypothetical protein